MVPRGVGPGDLELKDAPADRAESALGLQPPVQGQVPGFAQRQMHLLVEVFTELALAAQHFVGDVLRYERPGLLEKGLVLGAEIDG